MPDIRLSLSDNEPIAFCLDLHFDTQTPTSRIDDMFETATDKLYDIKNKCLKRGVKNIFFAGDIFNRIAVPHQGVNRLGEIFLDYLKSGITVYSILGNHDIVRNSLEAIDKSPTQTLFSFGLVKHICLSNPVILNDTCKITPCDYTEFPIKADSNFTYNILLAHCFYNASDLFADEKHNLTVEQVKELGYDFVCLGHDHEPYKDVFVGKSRVSRFGSVLRGTANSYNFTREPKFLVLHNPVNPSNDDFEYVLINHRHYEDIASEYTLNKQNMNSISGLQDVLSNLAEKLADTGESDGDRILDIIKNDPELPNDCRGLILKYLSEVG